MFSIFYCILKFCTQNVERVRTVGVLRPVQYVHFQCQLFQRPCIQLRHELAGGRDVGFRKKESAQPDVESLELFRWQIGYLNQLVNALNKVSEPFVDLKSEQIMFKQSEITIEKI